MNLSAEQLQNNWQILMKIIDTSISKDGPQNQFPDRKKKLLKMYNDLQERIMLAPASSQEDFHNCFPGGYLDHILNITSFATKLYNMWKDKGASVDDYCLEEIIFSAMHHDLGKVGDLEQEHYIPNPSDWHRKNQGKNYTSNPNLQFMSPPDRGIWILNQYGIKITTNEMLGIKLADGMYDDGNIQYLKTFSIEKRLKSNLPYIIHQADMMATRIEYERWVNYKKIEGSTISGPKKPNLTEKADRKKVDKLKKEFNELFKVS